MTDLFTPARALAAIKFKWQKEGDAKTYDYFVPHGLELAPGDKVIVETKRGEAEVEVVEIKTESEMAEKTILRRADPAPVEPETVPANDWNF
ncbi:primosomal protein N' family DNA-binding protein [Rhizobium mongolense]